jgi:hypothetical protein
MSTPAQISANQANSQVSTGPKTEEGKAAVAQNNFRHGLTSQFSVLPCESPKAYAALLTGLREEHQPSTITEEILVEKMAQSFWLTQRAQRFADVAIETGDDRKLALYLRYQTTNDRAFHKSLEQLVKLRAEKRKQEIGFESQKQKQAAAERQQEMHEARVRLTKAKSEHLELDTEIRSTIEARLPGHAQIPFSDIKGVLKIALEEVAQTRAEAA